MNVYAKLNYILEMICVLEEDYERRLSERPTNASKEFDLALMRDHTNIVELRKDGIRIALQAGDLVSEWYANRNLQAITAKERNVVGVKK